MIPLPGALVPVATMAFAGREVELDVLERARRATSHGRQVVVVTGEPGAGKTRLLQEFAVAAAADGATVLYGASSPSGTVSQQAIQECIGHLIDHLDDDELQEVVGASAGELVRLFPDLVGRVAGMTAPSREGSQAEQHRLHAALATLLANASRDRDVVVVVEDLNWADQSTLGFLAHLAGTVGPARLLVVLTYRDTEVDIGPGLVELLGQLARMDGVHRIHLAGLDKPTIRAMVQATGAIEPAAAAVEVVDALADLTAGNPFLVGELWRQLVDTGSLVRREGSWHVTGPLRAHASPERVREVIGPDLARLGPGTQQLLETAAVVGPQVDLGVLRSIVEMDEADLVAALEEAVTSGWFQPGTGPVPGYRFTHELGRRAVYDRLNPVARGRVHLRVATALERGGGDDARTVRALADHYTAAASLGVGEVAVGWCLRAADVAMRQLAFDETAQRLATALALGVPDRDRGRIHLQRGRALRASGAWREAIDSHRAAAEWAREFADPTTLATAALGLEETCWRPGITDAGAAELLAEAAGAIGSAPGVMRVMVLAALARAHGYRGNAEAAAEARRSAVALARELDDPRALAEALAQSYWGRGSDSAEQVIAAMAEAHDLATALGDLELDAYIWAWLVPALCEAGRIEEVRRRLPEFRAIAERLGQQVFLYHSAQSESALALVDARLGDAEQAADRALEYSRMGGMEATGAHGIQMFGIRREQGRLGELAPVARMLASQPDQARMWRPGLAVLLAEVGMEAAAGEEITRLCADDFAEVPHDALRLASLAYLADACWLIGDREHAAQLARHLEPLSGATVMVAGMVALLGAADRYLGMLASTRGDWDRAAAHFEAAVELDERTGIVTWPAWSRFAHARMLLERGRAADTARAAELLDTAARAAVRHGLPGLTHRIDDLRDAHAHALAPDGSVDLPAGLSERELDVVRLVAVGLSNREIGQRLFISPHTAANHVRSILMKTGSANRTEAAAFAHRHHLVGDKDAGQA